MVNFELLQGFMQSEVQAFCEATVIYCVCRPNKDTILFEETFVLLVLSATFRVLGMFPERKEQDGHSLIPSKSSECAKDHSHLRRALSSRLGRASKATRSTANISFIHIYIYTQTFLDFYAIPPPPQKRKDTNKLHVWGGGRMIFFLA